MKYVESWEKKKKCDYWLIEEERFLDEWVFVLCFVFVLLSIVVGEIVSIYYTYFNI